MDNDERYCRDKAAPPGSAAHYLLLLVPGSCRAPLLGLLALEQELIESVEACSGVEPALVRLAWWREELLGISAARHPATRLTGDALAGAAGLGAWLDATEGLATTAQFKDDAELQHLLAASAGTAARLRAALLSDRCDPTWHERLGVLAAETRLLRLPRRAGLPGHAGIPLERLRAHGVQPGRSGREALRSMQAAQVERLERDAAALACDGRREPAYGRAALGLLRDELRAFHRDPLAPRLPSPLSRLLRVWWTRPFLFATS